MLLQIKSSVSSGDESEIAIKPFKKKNGTIKVKLHGSNSVLKWYSQTLTYVIICEF